MSNFLHNKTKLEVNITKSLNNDNKTKQYSVHIGLEKGDILKQKGHFLVCYKILGDC